MNYENKFTALKTWKRLQFTVLVKLELELRLVI